MSAAVSKTVFVPYTPYTHDDFKKRRNYSSFNPHSIEFMLQNLGNMKAEGGMAPCRIPTTLRELMTNFGKILNFCKSMKASGFGIRVENLVNTLKDARGPIPVLLSRWLTFQAIRQFKTFDDYFYYTAAAEEGTETFHHDFILFAAAHFCAHLPAAEALDIMPNPASSHWRAVVRDSWPGNKYIKKKDTASPTMTPSRAWRPLCAPASDMKRRTFIARAVVWLVGRKLPPPPQLGSVCSFTPYIPFYSQRYPDFAGFMLMEKTPQRYRMVTHELHYTITP